MLPGVHRSPSGILERNAEIWLKERRTFVPGGDSDHRGLDPGQQASYRCHCSEGLWNRSEPAMSILMPACRLVARQKNLLIRLTVHAFHRSIIRCSMGDDKPRADLLPGTLDMLILKI